MLVVLDTKENDNYHNKMKCEFPWWWLISKGVEHQLLKNLDKQSIKAYEQQNSHCPHHVPRFFTCIIKNLKTFQFLFHNLELIHLLFSNSIPFKNLNIFCYKNE